MEKRKRGRPKMTLFPPEKEELLIQGWLSWDRVNKTFKGFAALHGITDEAGIRDVRRVVEAHYKREKRKAELKAKKRNYDKEAAQLEREWLS